MSEVAKTRLLRTLLDLREEQRKCERAADEHHDKQWHSYAEGLDYAVSEIVAALRIDGEEVWTSQVDQVEDVFGS
jgi:hypothetical protein